MVRTHRRISGPLRPTCARAGPPRSRQSRRGRGNPKLTAWCYGCGAQAKLHVRRSVPIHDFPAHGSPVVLHWKSWCSSATENTAKRRCSPRKNITSGHGKSSPGGACYRANKHLKKHAPLLHRHITRNHNQKRFFAKQLVPRVTAHEFIEDARPGPMLALWGQKFPPWVVSHPPDPAPVGLGGPESLPSIVSVRH